MKIKVLGSGGCRTLPRPTCKCRICNEARKFGEPYKRTGCSIFFADEKLLIDTSEDIVYQLNRENIDAVNHIFYSHWDPDHTLGMRVIEQLQDGSWATSDITNPVNVYGLKNAINEVEQIRNMFGSYMSYYKEKGLCKIQTGNSFLIDSLNISLYEVKTDIASTVFLFEEENKKLIYAPCDIKPFPIRKEFENADILIIGAFYPNSFKTTDKIKGTNTVMYSALYTIDEILEIKNKLKIKRVIITHLEEEWKLSFDDYKLIEKDYNYQIEFAFDGMKIIL